MSNLLRYRTIQNDRENFRRAGTVGGGEFNILDQPTTKFFKIFFYFDNGNPVGLLDPTWIRIKSGEGDLGKDLYNYNTAWSYLIMNDEIERAEILQQFVTLLSNINTFSPWYFSTVEGIDQALTRKVTTERDFKIEETRQKIVIKCLPDALDDRIGTLLDMYRSIVWSWKYKREVLPANLRKFDMGILIFDDSMLPFSHYIDSDDEKQDAFYMHSKTPELYGRSYKYIEFHNCELNYDSSAVGYGSMNNLTGVTEVNYNLEILFDDVYENRYNEFVVKCMGDMLLIDDLLTSRIDSLGGGDILNVITDTTLIDLLQERGQVNTEGFSPTIKTDNNEFTSYLLDYFTVDGDKKINPDDVGKGKIKSNVKNIERREPGKNDSLQTESTSELAQALKNAALSLKKISPFNAIKTAGDQAVYSVLNPATSLVKRALMGNLYTFSLTKMVKQTESLLQGNVRGAIENMKNYEKETKTAETQYSNGALGDMYPPSNIGTKYVNQKIGNLAQANTIVNNI